MVSIVVLGVEELRMSDDGRLHRVQRVRDNIGPRDTASV